MTPIDHARRQWRELVAGTALACAFLTWAYARVAPGGVL